MFPFKEVKQIAKDSSSKRSRSRKRDYSILNTERSIFEQKFFLKLHKAFLKKNPDRILSMGVKMLKKRLKASKIILHLTRLSVEGTLLYRHNPHERVLDIYEKEHVDMVPDFVNEFHKEKHKEPETLKARGKKIVLVPLITMHDEHIGVMELRFNKKKRISKIEAEEIDYYSEAFVSIIDDYRKQRQHLGFMRDLTGLVILLIMWSLFFMALSIIYAFSPAHYTIIFFIILFFILSSIGILFEEHLYTLKGWGIDMKKFLEDVPFYIGISAILITIAGVIKWNGWFGIPSDLGGGFLVFNWTWRDIFYPVSVPLQEMAARALPHTILRHVMKGWHKHITIVLISSLVFGFSHISFGVGMVLLTTLFGLILGALFEYKRNFWGICLVHMIVGYVVMTGFAFDILGWLN